MSIATCYESDSLPTLAGIGGFSGTEANTSPRSGRFSHTGVVVCFDLDSESVSKCQSRHLRDLEGAQARQKSHFYVIFDIGLCEGPRVPISNVDRVPLDRTASVISGLVPVDIDRRSSRGDLIRSFSQNRRITSIDEGDL
jgi:hypothetical protein